MKVLVLLPTGSLMGGGMLAGIQLIQALLENRKEMIVITNGIHDDLKKKLDEFGVTSYEVVFDWWIRGSGNDMRGDNFRPEMPHNADAIRKIINIINNENPDVALTHTIDMPWLAYAARACGIKHIWSIHEVINDKFWITRLKPEDQFEIVDSLSDEIFVNSRFTKESIERYFKKEIKVMPPFFLDKTDINKRSIGATGFDKNQFNIVLSGNFSSLKRQLDAVKALRHLRQLKIYPKLYLIGHFGNDDDHYNVVKKFISKHNLSSQVKITGHKNNPLAYSKEADLQLMCSDNESFGMVTVEAMAVGTPVIGAKAGGTIELIDNNKNGYFYKVGDYKDLAMKIKHVFENYGEAEKKAKIAKEYVFKNFSKKSNYKQLLATLKVEPNKNIQRDLVINDIISVFLQADDQKRMALLKQESIPPHDHGSVGRTVKHLKIFIPKRLRPMLKKAIRRSGVEVEPKIDVKSKKVNIIVPVYADWATLKINIDSLITEVSGKNNVNVWYMNDCGPEADDLEKKIIKRIDGHKNFHYVRNPKNLGFVKNCNNAVFNVVDNDGDVLLLNSDTRVTTGFLEVMLRVLYSNRKIGAVSPRSNNATQWSVPMDAKYAQEPDRAYLFWKEMLHALPYSYICPTAHGFCMLIRRDVIDKYGLFDEIYGAGYAEETDFTMRIRKHGIKCAVANHAFVFHYESKSFGSERRNRLIKKNREIIIGRYPDVFKLMEQYVASIKEPQL